MMRAPLAIAFAVLAALPAAADECMTLWLERNGIFDAGGYCFTSQLGIGYFGNAGCTPGPPQVTSAQAARIDALRAREGALNCAARSGGWTVATLRAAAAGGAPGALPAAVEDARAVQSALAAAGFPVGAIDGVMGASTREAIMRWQARRGARATGTLTPEERDALLGLAGARAIAAAPGGAAAISMAGRMVIPIGGGAAATDYLTIAALARLPEFARIEPLRAAISAGRLTGFFAYGEGAAEDMDTLRRIAGEVGRLSLPVPDRVTLELTAELRRLPSALRAPAEADAGPIEVPLPVDGAERIAPYASVPLPGTGGVALDLELRGAPRVDRMILSPSEAAALRPRAELLASGLEGAGRVYVHVDVEAFGPSEDGLDLRLAGTVDGADIRLARPEGGPGAVVHVYRGGSAAPVPVAADPFDLHAAMVRLAQRDPAEPVGVPRIGGALLLDDGRAVADFARTLHASALLAARPDLLDGDEAAVAIGTRLLTWEERARLYRGTDAAAAGVPARGEGGLGPFDLRAVAERLRGEMRPVLAGRAMNGPIAAVRGLTVRLGAYDAAAGAVALQVEPQRGDLLRLALPDVPGEVRYALSPSFAPPASLPLPAEGARAVLASLSRTPLRLGLHMDLPPVPGPPEGAAPAAGEPAGPAVVPVPVLRAVLYAGPAMEIPIHEFEPAAFAADIEDVATESFGPADLPTATHRDIVGAALLAGGPLGAELLDAIVARTPSYPLVREARRDDYRAALAARYTDGLAGRPIWVPAAVRLFDPDPATRRASVTISLDVAALERGDGREDPGIAAAPARADVGAVHLPGALVIDDETLARMGWATRAAPPDERQLAQSFAAANGATFGSGALGTPIAAIVRIEPRARALVPGRRAADPPSLRIAPRILEAYVFLENRRAPGDAHLLLHHVDGEAGAPPAADLAARSLVLVRPAGAAQIPPTALVHSCVDPRLIPSELAGLIAVPLPAAGADAVRMYADLIDEPVIWLTRADCLAGGIAGLDPAEAGPDLVMRGVHARAFVPVPGRGG